MVQLNTISIGREKVKIKFSLKFEAFFRIK